MPSGEPGWWMDRIVALNGGNNTNATAMVTLNPMTSTAFISGDWDKCLRETERRRPKLVSAPAVSSSCSSSCSASAAAQPTR